MVLHLNVLFRSQKRLRDGGFTWYTSYCLEQITILLLHFLHWYFILDFRLKMDLTRKLEDNSRAHNDERNVSIGLDLTNVPGAFEFLKLILVSSPIRLEGLELGSHEYQSLD